MSFVWNDLNLINCLTFYYLLMFALSTFRRWQHYREMIKLVIASAHRWPHLLKLVKQHRTIFMTWQTVAPLALAAAIALLQILATEVIIPQAADLATGLTLHKLFSEPVMAAVVLSLLAGMLSIDVYFLINVGSFERPQLEKYFDQAEYWLVSKMAHVVKIVTFGWINPRRMVADEVRKALVDASNLVNRTLWWVNLQMALRFFFGLSLWIAWAWGRIS